MKQGVESIEYARADDKPENGNDLKYGCDGSDAFCLPFVVDDGDVFNRWVIFRMVDVVSKKGCKSAPVDRSGNGIFGASHLTVSAEYTISAPARPFFSIKLDVVLRTKFDA
jgi:hypothetical protein